ncbi:hypothetical protein Patl1_01132 [Pistacia atlantica]|uniref:Uncharacterized protein n=1 Tax=Pistacia atlantica TaxID=434234 RepID=A0ACC1C9Q0_9ROSI|nr:hypothetical protein Patl1_01132 [Pistacia atlantica]
MYVTPIEVDIDEMGYSMSRLDIESDYFDGDKSISEASNSHNKIKKPLNNLDHEIAQLTKLKSTPHEKLSKVIPGKQGLPVSVVKMLAAREGNYSGRGRFSSVDCCHILSRYLPVNGPWLVDQITSRAYVSQFSADGSLFVAGFQVVFLHVSCSLRQHRGSQIRIYDVERGWKLQKDIRAKSLHWTITDTSLSPDKRHIVYASMSPIVHIVNVGSGATESHANITVLVYNLMDRHGFLFDQH